MGLGSDCGGCPSCGPENKEPRLRVESAAPGPIFGPATLLGEPEPQTPSSALRGRQGMDIIEQRRLVALREFSWRLKGWVFIGCEV